MVTSLLEAKTGVKCEQSLEQPEHNVKRDQGAM